MSTNTSSQDKIAHIRELLEQGQTEKALQFIEKNASQSPEMKNAQGVCLMRLGRIQAAMDVLREVAFQNFMCIPKSTPPLYQANYATVLLMKNYNQDAMEIIKGLPASAHPYVEHLHQTIYQWQTTLPLHHRVRCLLGLYPATPVQMTFAPGDV